MRNDDSIIAVGPFAYLNGNISFSFSELDSNGNFVTSPLPNEIIVPNTILNNIKIDQNGNILLSGDIRINRGNSPFSTNLTRLNADYSLDTSFTSSAFQGNMNIVDVLPIGDKILLTGSNFTPEFIRLDYQGNSDPDFIESSLFASPPEQQVGIKILIDSNNSIWLGGNFNQIQQTVNGDPFTYDYNHLVKLNFDGSVDTTFVDLGLNAAVTNMIMVDNHIIVAGDFSITVGSNTYNKLFRMDLNGIIDDTFDPYTHIDPINVFND